MHLGLLIVANYGLEQRIRVPIGRPTRVLSLAISISSQTFAIIYLAAVLYLTQRLALRRILRSGPRTMTSIHDRQLAWSGLGSAANAWWNQLWIPASIWGVGIITLYLALTAALKVTTPALFRLVLANQTASFAVNSTLSSPFLHPSLILMDKGGRADDEFGLGLQHNMLYDVLAVDAGPGTTTVNTHTMHVTCGTSPTGSISEPLRPVTIDGALYWNPSLTSYGYPQIPETGDTSGRVASQVFLEPPMNPVLKTFEHFSTLPWPNFNITAISNFNVSSLSSSPLDTSSRKPLRQDTPRKTTSSWTIGDSEHLSSTGDVERLHQSLQFSFLSRPKRCRHYVYVPTPMYISDTGREDVGPVANVMLHNLENALEDYAAAFYWSLAYLRNLPTIQEVEVTGTQMVSQLQLDTLPAVAGMSFSVALLLISPILVGLRPTANKRKEKIDFDTLGVLETVWLAGSESAVTAVGTPSTKHLQKAGMLLCVGKGFRGRPVSKIYAMQFDFELAHENDRNTFPKEKIDQGKAIPDVPHEAAEIFIVQMILDKERDLCGWRKNIRTAKLLEGLTYRKFQGRR
ncbi:hypothetical protein C8J57DRAFT_1581780 [Mycena rebaudengoi]|nr:hypothetical protein C8J57DRAFT_1581780 [Mycena rebaudengoi]